MSYFPSGRLLAKQTGSAHVRRALRIMRRSVVDLLNTKPCYSFARGTISRIEYDKGRSRCGIGRCMDEHGSRSHECSGNNNKDRNHDYLKFCFTFSQSPMYRVRYGISWVSLQLALLATSSTVILSQDYLFSSSTGHKFIKCSCSSPSHHHVFLPSPIHSIVSPARPSGLAALYIPRPIPMTTAPIMTPHPTTLLLSAVAAAVCIDMDGLALAVVPPPLVVGVACKVIFEHRK
jgi:hypothetical protein